MTDASGATSVRTEASVKAAMCEEASYQAWVLAQDHYEELPNCVLIDPDHLQTIYDFGCKHAWPPAEAFARQYAEICRAPFDPEEWASSGHLRVAWEVFRAVGHAVSGIDLGIAPRAAAPAVAVRPRDPDDDALERVAGAFDRERIGAAPTPQAAEPASAGTPLSAVDGIGEKIEAALMAAGIANVEELAALNPDRLYRMGSDSAGAADRKALELINDRQLIGAAKDHLASMPPA